MSEAKQDDLSRQLRSVVPTEGNQPTEVPARPHEPTQPKTFEEFISHWMETDPKMQEFFHGKAEKAQGNTA